MSLKDDFIKTLPKTSRESGEYTTDDPSKIGSGGVKYDGGKTPIWRGALSYFPLAIESIAKISAFGAIKYAWGGWKSVDDGFNRYTDGLSRHLFAEARGELYDPESGYLHAEHVAWNACARLELLKKQLEEKNDE